MVKVFKKILKNNFELMACFLLLGIILIITINPVRYMNSAFSGLRVWAEIVLPSSFIFFILTKLVMQNKKTKSIFAFLSKPLNKIYNSSNLSGYIFAMSIIGGYPLGAKLISEFYNKGQINIDQAHHLISFCSTSSPIFIVGTVGIGMLNNTEVGILILISHVFSALINGLFYKNYKTNKLIYNKKLPSTDWSNKQSLNEIMQDTIISVLMVGGFIALSFTLLEVIDATKAFYPIINLTSKINQNLADSMMAVFSGIIELTSGCCKLCLIHNTDIVNCIAFSALTSFGGISIHLQTQIFLKNCDIEYKYFLKTKVTQTIISIILSAILANIIL